MSQKKIIAVLGATGSQGGGLARAILADPDGPFAVRALTRSAQSDSARALAAAGAEVVEADLFDESSLRRAFDGAYGAFVVTNYWAERTPEEEAAQSRAEMELAQAQAAANAAKDAGLAHVIWSTLEDTREHFGDDDRVPTVDGGYKVPHFDAKGEANELFIRLGVPTTFLQTAFFFEGFTTGMGPARVQDGKLILTLPMADKPMSSIAVEDIGKTALGIFKRGEDFIGKTVSIAGEHLTGNEYAAALTEALVSRSSTGRTAGTSSESSRRRSRWSWPTCSSSTPRTPTASPATATSTWSASSTRTYSPSRPGSPSTSRRSRGVRGQRARATADCPLRMRARRRASRSPGSIHMTRRSLVPAWLAGQDLLVSLVRALLLGGNPLCQGLVESARKASSASERLSWRWSAPIRSRRS